MKKMIGFPLAAALLVCAGCSSSKELNERSAQNLLKEATAATSYPISLAPITPLMQRTYVDFATLGAEFESKGVEKSTAILVVKRLIEHKLVVVQTEKVPYPNVHGTFRSDISTAAHYDEYDLEPVPNSTMLTGQLRHKGERDRETRVTRINGTVEANGIVTLPAGKFQYTQQGSESSLLDKDIFDKVNFTGPAGGPPREVTFYTYSFSPEMQSQLEQVNTAPFGIGQRLVTNAHGGAYVIGQISDLQLATDTTALATFAWTVSLNKLGQLLLEGSDKPSGNGRVAFAKKPDGTWVVKEWCAMNCTM